MAKKLFEKAGLISPPGSLPRPSPPSTAPAEPPRAKTAPGSMLHFMGQQSAAMREVEELREQIKEFEGALPERSLDPLTIRASKWANRHSASFSEADFEVLKEEIRAAGGNVQAIKVRPVRVLNGSTPEPDVLYELVFGHRRHRACLELGLPVRAVIEDLSDQELFQQMERENRSRKNLSAWEQGRMYRQALEDGLYPSLRKLAESVGVDVALVSRSVTLARLPDAVIEAFPSPLEIQFRWAGELSEALQKDPDGMIRRAQALAALLPRPAARQVFETLTRPTGEVLNGSTPEAIPIQVKGKTVAMLETDSRGRTVVRIKEGVLESQRRYALAELIGSFLADG